MAVVAYAPRPDNHVRRWSQAKMVDLLDGLPVGTSFSLTGGGYSVYGGTWTKNAVGLWNQTNAAAPLLYNMSADMLGFVVDWRRVEAALAR